MRSSLNTGLLLLGLLLGSLSLSGQDKVRIIGRVLDDVTGEPLPMAHVYLNNSTLGTTTDNKGAFVLAGLPIGNLEMVVSYVGYQTLKSTLRFETGGDKRIQFRVTEGQVLKELTVFSDSKARRRIVAEVSRELLGKSKFAEDCELINPQVLNIRRESDHLMAQSSSALIVENNALGYRIYQDVESFDLYEGRMYTSGSTRFEEMKPKNAKQLARWKRNRDQAYRGSLKHLLVSLVADRLAEDGFQVNQQVQPPGPNSAFRTLKGAQLIAPGDIPSERRLVSDAMLQVFYLKKRGVSPYYNMPYAYTEITLPAGFMVITTNGWVVTPMQNTIAGYLGNDRLSSLLPADWEPEAK